MVHHRRARPGRGFAPRGDTPIAPTAGIGGGTESTNEQRVEHVRRVTRRRGRAPRGRRARLRDSADE